MNYNNNVNGLGCIINQDITQFTLYCPHAHKVMVEIFETFYDKKGRSIEMKKQGDGRWHASITENLVGYYYVYQVQFLPKNAPFSDQCIYTIADPFSKLVATINSAEQPAKTKIIIDDYNWQGDVILGCEDIRDLVIYEAHLNDMTRHISSQCTSPGTYSGFIETGQKGGLPYLEKLGINAIEFLPLQKFQYVEPPYMQYSKYNFFNHWNIYERNYWGYMTSFYYVPETRYGKNGNNDYGAINGKDKNVLNEIKDMIRELHRKNIRVIMDIVLNHTSHYDRNPLSIINRKAFYRHNHEGFLNYSGTGNDLKTENPWIRDMIIDVCSYWMDNFHVDGFRFDLAGLFDDITSQTLIEKLRSKNKKVILIAEPWGGTYALNKMAYQGWACWHDKYRNAIKGESPYRNKGFIFGEWSHHNSRKHIEAFLGCSQKNNHDSEPIISSQSSVNYLESHDGNTLGDFIRIVYRQDVQKSRIINNIQYTHLTQEELSIAKLAALSLFVSQGCIMIHSGQEWAKAKITSSTHIPNPHIHTIDHNSYEKDDETNYLNYELIKCNQTLWNYYQGLIKLRLSSPALRKSSANAIHILPYEDPLHISYIIDGTDTQDPNNYLISLNGRRNISYTLDIPYTKTKKWSLLVDGEKVYQNNISKIINKTILVPPSTGMVLSYKRPI